MSEQTNTPQETCSPFKIHVSDTLKERMDRDLILDDDILAVLDYCETTGNKLFNKENDSFVGHCQLGVITLWIEYKRHGNDIDLISVYSHRMQIGDVQSG